MDLTALAAGTLLDPIDSRGRQWIELMPTADKARNGPYYFTITRADLDTYADFIRSNPDRIVVDYDHEGHNGGATVAAGWFTGEAEVRDTDDGPRLFAQVEWTDKGRSDVESKRYRFVSAEFNFAQKDAKSGLMTKAKALVAATVTNRPFFKQLAALAASSGVQWTDQMGFQRRFDLVREALNGDPPMYPPRYCVIDVDTDLALVSDWDGDDAWVVPYTINADGDAELGPQSDWTAVEQQWVTDSADAAAKERELIVQAAKWTTGYINDLPDSAFLHVEPGGKKDSDGKTTPRSLRHWPVKNADGDVDLPHVRDALARIPQTKGLPDSVKEAAQNKARRLLGDNGGTPATNQGDPMDLTAMAAAVGLPEDSDEATILAAVKAAKEKADNAPADGTIVLTSEQVAELQTNAAAGLKASEELKALRIDSLLADAVRAGRIVPAQKDSLRAWGLQDEDALKAHIEATPENTFAMRARGSDAGAGEDGGPDLERVAEAFAHEDYGIDEEQAALHVKATEILATAGKQSYTADEYLAAMAAAQRELGATYRDRPKATRGDH